MLERSKSKWELVFCSDSIEYALYGWGPSITGIGKNFKSKEKMVPHPIIGFDKKVKSIALGNDHCAVVTGIKSIWR